jgi:CheY-like chemotaxis protein/HPt (histidine-containing phosphotransfer) domain-containing protein
MVLADANMPDVDGFQLVEQIRGDANLGNTAIMMLSSGDRSLGVTRCEKLSVAAYLMKPVKRSELLEAILVATGASSAIDDLAASSEQTFSTDLPPLRILLAEDSLVNQKLTIGLLNKHGHEVVVANTGIEAVARATQETFDVVLMDVQMPELDGLEATRQIRQQEKSTGRRAPIVALTAHALVGDRERCLEAGMDDYLSKPIRGRNLFAAIRRAVADRAVVGPSHGDDSTAESRSGVESTQFDDPVDWNEAFRSVQGDRRLLGELVDAFLEQCPTLLTQIRDAVQAADGPALSLAAHALKGSVRYFDPRTAFEAAYRLETIGREFTLDKAEPAVAELQAAIEQTCDSLRRWREREQLENDS